MDEETENGGWSQAPEVLDAFVLDAVGHAMERVNGVVHEGYEWSDIIADLGAGAELELIDVVSNLPENVARGLLAIRLSLDARDKITSLLHEAFPNALPGRDD